MLTITPYVLYLQLLTIDAQLQYLLSVHLILHVLVVFRLVLESYHLVLGEFVWHHDTLTLLQILMSLRDVKGGSTIH